ncbi:type VII toxin-antitoxin system HepT family RNase toxin [Trujillonella humicola]|uniref:type VII toxin-antitoxin system HepT family RNase toxin n=1 Tax=Trujillonella humicola TaxID=3383699 RepID=UPI0039063AD6
MTPRRLDPASVQAKLRSLDDLRSALDLVGEVDGARLGQDVLLRLAVERALTQAVDLVVAVCGHVLAAQSASVPTTYRDAVRGAAEHGLIDAGLAQSLVAAVGLRNLLVHEYARADLAIVAAAVPVARRDLEEFVRQVATWLQRDR